ncbi:hypothetical protein HN018_27400 (plasmid) [Lichenicola cladoniae]|uniref:Uncharacterized protein n=1 Tax=Lichenicola cladoniae TaxID=1484109 RepID=A0A6M8HZ68_9PROT|nr:DUF6516 family protein [Lichenicola cladoniae]NPD69993.1 hypothetical protein [Acetobacteraceae bacterium]QKE93864.1 hypothetical protein HN018_27400 [Lichenicola cladoniae]
MSDDGMRRLLDYHRRRIWMANGWCLRFQVKEVALTQERPYGIKYSFTLHDMDMARLLGFDNAHGLPRRIAYDHQHKFKRTERLVPYIYHGTDELLVDFFDEVERACLADGVEFEFDDQEIELEEELDDGKEVSD